MGRREVVTAVMTDVYGSPELYSSLPWFPGGARPSKVLLVEVKLGLAGIDVGVLGALLCQDFAQSLGAAQERSHHRPEDISTTLS